MRKRTEWVIDMRIARGLMKTIMKIKRMATMRLLRWVSIRSRQRLSIPFNSRKPIVVAHRGCSGLAPENTMAAFKLAAADPGIAWIELDVQLSKDGIPVVIHDYKLQRTTSTPGEVKDYSMEQLTKLDNGSWFSPQFHNERIPTLDQVLREFQGRIKLNIELKTKDQLYPGLEQAVIDLVRAYSMENDVVITSFDTRALQLMKRLAPSIRTGLITSNMSNTIKEQLLKLEANLLSVDYRIVDPNFIHSMIDSGFEVMVWTVNEPQSIDWLICVNPTIWICTNYPDRF